MKRSCLTQFPQIICSLKFFHVTLFDILHDYCLAECTLGNTNLDLTLLYHRGYIVFNAKILLYQYRLLTNILNFYSFKYFPYILTSPYDFSFTYRFQVPKGVQNPLSFSGSCLFPPHFLAHVLSFSMSNLLEILSEGRKTKILETREQ